MLSTKILREMLYRYKYENANNEKQIIDYLLENLFSQQHICQRCGMPYSDNDSKTKYCFECRKDKNLLMYEKRKSNHARFTHKKVADKIRQRGINTQHFLEESNYYWAVVRGIKPATRKLKHYKDIKTESQYQEWLDSQLRN